MSFQLPLPALSPFQRARYLQGRCGFLAIALARRHDLELGIGGSYLTHESGHIVPVAQHAVAVSGDMVWDASGLRPRTEYALAYSQPDGWLRGSDEQEVMQRFCVGHDLDPVHEMRLANQLITECGWAQPTEQPAPPRARIYALPALA